MSRLDIPRLEEGIVRKDIQQAGFLDDLPDAVLDWRALGCWHGIQIDRDDCDVVAKPW